MTPPNQPTPAGRLLSLLGPFLGLLLVIGLFSLSPTVRPYFLSGANFKIILTQTVIVAIGALGMTMIIVSGGIDLSVGSAIALTSVLAAYLMQSRQSIWIPYGAALGVGALIGLINGTIIAGFRMTPFIVTLGMLGIARGLAKWRADNQTVNLPYNAIGPIQILMADPDPENPASWF